MKNVPLTRDEVRRVVRGEGQASRVPVLLHMWTNPYAHPQTEAVLNLISQYEQDVQVIPIVMPGGASDCPDYQFVKHHKTFDPSVGLDNRPLIDDWADLDEILENFPKADDYPNLYSRVPAPDGRYRVIHWWYLLFERHWSLRGMENALTDFLEYPDEVHRLYRALTDFYIGVITRGQKESHFDGVITSDDLGTQTGPFFSNAILNEFFLPYYKEITTRVHELDMDFWLHTCGNIKAFIPGFIDAGIDVLHPIQKYTMDEREIAAQFGGKITIWAGMDVQRTIPYGTPEDVRREIRFLFDTYRRPDGRFLFTAGNGITGDTPLPLLEALYDEAYNLYLK